MAVSSLFEIGRSALLASQKALTVTSHNIANVNTPGFSRQEVVLNVANPVLLNGSYLGMGVTALEVTRHYDSFVQSQLLLQYQNYGSSSAQKEALGQIEQIFNETQNLGLSTSISEFFDAWQEVSANPEGMTQRSVLLQKAGSFVLSARQMERGILDSLSNIDDQVAGLAGQVNAMASEIAGLNKSIQQMEGGTGDGSALDLRDRRTNLLNELGKIIEISTYEDKGTGAVNVTAGMQNLVSGDRAHSLEVTFDTEGRPGLSLDAVDITPRVAKGEIGGLLTARQSIENSQLQGLRTLVSSVVEQVNGLHRSGYGLDGVTGRDLFIAGTTPDSVISELSVNVTDPGQIAAAASVASVPGDNQTALQIAGLRDAQVAALGNVSFETFYRGLVTTAAGQSKAASDSLTFDENLLAEIEKKRDALSSVSLDEEAANLIRFQRSYEAGARMIKIADELLQTLLAL
jgi:flagellar hook-associated protein 1 FlgK